MASKLKTLKWFDILILSLILFTDGIINSSKQYLALLNHTSELADNVTFSNNQNYQALVFQTTCLLIAFIYLYFRGFDFKIWLTKIKFKPVVILQAILIFILSAISMDLFYLVSYQLSLAPAPSLYKVFQSIDISLILYSLLNGFYEEIFFLGVCLTVHPRYTKRSFLYSLIIRTSFHTYQGLGTALAIGLILGSLFYFIYRKLKPENLLPFFLAHAIADMIGLSFLFYF